MDFISSLGTGDVFIMILVLVGATLSLFSLSRGGDILALIFVNILFIIIPIGILIYLNHIPNGNYRAQTIEKNGMVVGKGTIDSRQYNFNITNEKLSMDGWAFYYNQRKSNPYITVYTYKDFPWSVTVTKMGNVRTYMSELEVKTQKLAPAYKTSKIKVAYK